jgi:hypothetical protein
MPQSLASIAVLVENLAPGSCAVGVGSSTPAPLSSVAADRGQNTNTTSTYGANSQQQSPTLVERPRTRLRDGIPRPRVH